MKIRSAVIASVIALAGVAVPFTGADAASGVTVKGSAAGAGKALLMTASGKVDPSAVRVPAKQGLFLLVTSK